MPQNESINTSEDYVNYTFHISSKGVGTVAGELVGLSNTVSNLLGDIAFKTSEMLSHTETLAIGTGIAVGAMFTSAMSSAVRFEQQMANVKAIGGESLNAQEIGNAAMEYSNKYGMAVSSMTEGLEALSRAGITTTSVMKSVSATLPEPLGAVSVCMGMLLLCALAQGMNITLGSRPLSGISAAVGSLCLCTVLCI